MIARTSLIVSKRNPTCCHAERRAIGVAVRDRRSAHPRDACPSLLPQGVLPSQRVPDLILVRTPRIGLKAVYSLGIFRLPRIPACRGLGLAQDDRGLGPRFQQATV